MSHWHSNEQISPWHNHAPDTANYSSATGVDHPALCEELRNKVQFSIPQAFIVQGCCSGVRAPRGQCTADINIGKLKTIVARAGTSEKDVYDPLVSNLIHHLCLPVLSSDHASLAYRMDHLNMSVTIPSMARNARSKGRLVTERSLCRPERGAAHQRQVFAHTTSIPLEDS